MTMIPMKLTPTLVTIVFGSLVVVAGTADAQKKDKDRADALFKQGKRLMADKRYSEACEAFEESFKLDPGIGAELNTARCYEEWGKLRRAYRAYQQADQMAKDANDAREPKIADLVAQLDPQVPKLTIRLPPGGAPKHLVVQVDGEPLDAAALGKARRIDPGPHTIEWTVDDAPKQTKVVPVERGGNSELVLDVPHETVVRESTPEPVRDVRNTNPEQDPGRGWKIGAYVTGGVGIALIGVSSYLAFSARSDYRNALAADCNGATNMCDPTGLTATHDARSKANIATGVFVGGAIAVGVGITLFVLAPRATHGEHALRVVPEVNAHGGALALDGRF
jgi:tetratricopeptide (TPR) repeat protein